MKKYRVTLDGTSYEVVIEKIQDGECRKGSGRKLPPPPPPSYRSSASSDAAR